MTKKQHWQSSKHQKGMKDEMLRMNRMQCDLVNGQKMNESDLLVRQVYEIEYRLYKQPIRIEHHHPFDCQVSIVRIHSSEMHVTGGALLWFIQRSQVILIKENCDGRIAKPKKLVSSKF